MTLTMQREMVAVSEVVLGRTIKTGYFDTREDAVESLLGLAFPWGLATHGTRVQEDLDRLREDGESFWVVEVPGYGARLFMIQALQTHGVLRPGWANEKARRGKVISAQGDTDHPYVGTEVRIVREEARSGAYWVVFHDDKPGSLWISDVEVTA